MNPPDLLQSLLTHLQTYPRLLLAYSGGVDSTLLAAAALKTHAPENLRICLADSPSLPRRELATALQTAAHIGFDVHILHTQELTDPHYAANPHNRCFFCKSELFDRLLHIAARENFPTVLDGTNASDLHAHRPSRPAAAARNIRSPLAELHITKEQVRQLARHLHLPVAEKPAAACLASRIPTGTPVTAQTLAQIESAEDALAALGFNHLRVRHHNEVARIELPPDDLPRALALRTQILTALKDSGYRQITLDLAGYAPATPPIALTVSATPQHV
ncbi:MAG: ATP-dependent sacrificial sulfur transferase LarE [Phycisphaerae bacterium]